MTLDANRHEIDAILAEIKSLEPFPQVAMRVLQLSQSDDVLPREIIRVVETDPGITAKVLKLCNSAYYGFKRDVGSLFEAGNMLGVRTLVDLVITSSASRYFRNYGESKSDSSTDLWRRSITNAWAAQLLAETSGGVDKSRAYTLGLLQDIGHVVAERFVSARWEDIRGRVGEGANLLQAEAEVLGIDHAEIGARLASRWDLPEGLVDCIRWHHEPEQATVDPDLAWYAHLADAVTSTFFKAEDADAEGVQEPTYALDPSAYASTGIEAAALGSIEEQLRASLEQAQEFVEM